MTNRPAKQWDVPKRRFFINQAEPDMDIPDGDVMKGEKIYNTACTGCHQLDDSNWMGPAMRDVYNKRFASKKFPYSPGMHARKGEYWTRDRLYHFLEDCDSIIPETSMWFDGIKDPYDRASVVEYLHYLRVKTA